MFNCILSYDIINRMRKKTSLNQNVIMMEHTHIDRMKSLVMNTNKWKFRFRFAINKYGNSGVAVYCCHPWVFPCVCSTVIIANDVAVNLIWFEWSTPMLIKWRLKKWSWISSRRWNTCPRVILVRRYVRQETTGSPLMFSLPSVLLDFSLLGPVITLQWRSKIVQICKWYDVPLHSWAKCRYQCNRRG